MASLAHLWVPVDRRALRRASVEVVSPRLVARHPRRPRSRQYLRAVWLGGVESTVTMIGTRLAGDVRRCCGCLLLCACGTGLSASVARADPLDSTIESPRAAGVQPPVPLSRPVANYPDEALQEGIEGDVVVEVDIDAFGNVVRADIVEGLPVFRDAALEAALLLSFEPARQDGAPVPATIRVRLDFSPPQEMVVHAADPDIEDVRARTTLLAKDLERSAGEGLADSVESVPGVRVAGGTADAAKPIIRGHAERRLLVLYDGVRHESQKWGPDHAPEIDPVAAGSIAVIRGAAGARYGPDAIGGVILVEPPPLRTRPGVGGTVLAGYAANGRRPHAALRLVVIGRTDVPEDLFVIGSVWR